MHVDFGTITLVAFVAALLSTLATAVIAFVAPLFSHGVKLGEFRQAWINEQRKDVADYMGLAREWVELWDQVNIPGGGTNEQKKEMFTLANKALVVFWRIQMRLNPLPGNPQAAQDAEFLQRLRVLLQPPPPDPNGVNPPEVMWRKEAEKALAQAQAVFKTEWEVTKKTSIRSIWERWRRDRNASDEKIRQLQGQ